LNVVLASTRLDFRGFLGTKHSSLLPFVMTQKSFVTPTPDSKVELTTNEADKHRNMLKH